MEGKRKGRRAYLNDFTASLNGEYVYRGSHWHYVGKTPWKRQLFTLWALAGGMAAALLAGGLLPAAGMNGTIYVVLPYLASLVAGGTVVWAMARVAPKGVLRAYVYEATILKLPGRSRAVAVLSLLAGAGEAGQLIARGSGGKTAESILYLLLELAAGAAAWILSRRVKATDWSERTGGEIDTGL